jgi:hypothetical protein
VSHAPRGVCSAGHFQAVPVLACAAMAGYSGTPLPRKLGIKPGHRVIAIGAPASFVDALVLPERAQLHSHASGRSKCDVMLLFVTRRADFEAKFSKLAAKVAVAGGIWVAWPKATAKKMHRLDSDMTENVIREVVIPLGYVDNKVCAIDETWSGLRCVLRLEHRPKKHPG